MGKLNADIAALLAKLTNASASPYPVGAVPITAASGDVAAATAAATLAASATKTTIVVSCPTLGTGALHNAVVAYGFQL